MWLWAVGLVIAIGALLAWLVRAEFSRWLKQEILASLQTAKEDFLTLATQRLSTERVQQTGELEQQKRAVETAVQGLREQLTRYESLIREFERDRDRKYGSLNQQLTAAVTETQKLHQTTAQLTAMLGNAKIRGQWGEKTADDILRACGLQEEIHYQKQKNAPLGRPDVTFLLPGDHRLYMDVKFPLDNYIKLANWERDDEQRRVLKEQFLRDVRAHLKELERRDYAPTGGDEPDYVLMFIPNEQVYGAVNDWMPGLIDEALDKRIILCGPWTLYAHVRLIWQAWQHYYHAQAIGEITRTVSEFLKAYERFKTRFEELGDKLGGALEGYEDIVRTSFAQLERKITQIEDYRRGQGGETSLPAPEEPSVLLPQEGVRP